MESLTEIQGECRIYSDQIDTHDHPFAQLILPLQGSLFIETSQHELELDDARLFFLPPGCLHTFHAKQTNKFLVLDIPTLFLTQADINRLQGGLVATLDGRWQALRSLLLSELFDASSTPDLTNLFQYAYRLLLKDCVPRSLQYIHANYYQSIRLETLAKLEGYTATYYCEWFKKITGTSLKTYIQTIRLAKAKELLLYSNFSILDIAQQVGYDHHSSLTRLFQQREGMTPLAYRQQIRRLDK